MPTDAPFVVSTDDLVIKLKGCDPDLEAQTAKDDVNPCEGLSSDAIRILKGTLITEFGKNAESLEIIRSAEIRDQMYDKDTRITTLRIRLEYFEKDSKLVGGEVAELGSADGKYIFNLKLIQNNYPFIKVEIVQVVRIVWITISLRHTLSRPPITFSQSEAPKTVEEVPWDWGPIYISVLVAGTFLVLVIIKRIYVQRKKVGTQAKKVNGKPNRV
jgi:hypothetical protein